MNKLFLITWRWLKRDKKRTALTFCSIVLSVYLISFVGVYLSTALSSYRASVAYDAPYHAILYLENVDQAKALNKNAAWESHCLYAFEQEFMGHHFLNNYSEDDGIVFPIMEINGSSVYNKHLINAAIIDGDAEESIGTGNFKIIGELPKQAHEVAVSTQFAASYGDLKIGDTVTIAIGTQSGKFYYAEAEDPEKIYPPEEIVRDDEGNISYIDHKEYDENGELIYAEAIVNFLQPKRDDNGNVIYIEDTDGSKLKEIYGFMNGGYDFLVHNYYCDLRTGMNGDRFYTLDENVIPPGYAELSGEKELIINYTATVTGITGSGYDDYGGVIMFSPNDSEILPFFGGTNLDYYVRVKSGIDVDDIVGKALDGVGIIDDPEDITDDVRYELNTELLVLEGRQLEYLGKVGLTFAFAIIILFMFVFLARLIINNAFEISAMYRTEQYGALKTIGASDKQIFVMIMFECALYMLTALPIGFLGAVGTGKLVISKIREIGVFDPIYGEGISERFFSLELSPAVMIITFLCAAFSIFFSSYADAMRVRRMPPIRSVGYGSMKKVKNKRSRWLSRSLGYPNGFAVKCISKEKVRFTVTLLSAVMSGIFIMTSAGVAKLYSDSHPDHVVPEPDIVLNPDYCGDEKILNEVKDAIIKINASDYFEEVFLRAYCDVQDDLSSGANNKYYTDEYLQFNSYQQRKDQSLLKEGMQIRAITREQYDKYITADMSYDEFIANGNVLLCKSVAGSYVYGYEDYGRYWTELDIPVLESYQMSYGYCFDVLDIPMFNTDDIDEIVFKGTYYKQSGKGEEYTESVKIAGFYETTNPYFINSSTSFAAIMPIENFTTDMFDFQKESRMPTFIYDIQLYVKNGWDKEACALLTEVLPDASITDNSSENALNRNLVMMIRIAGFGFAISLAAVVLLNIFSTASANMINRRRDLNIMRSCGMSIKQVRKSLFFEVRIYAFVTMIVSSLVGWVLAVFIYNLFFEVTAVVAENYIELAIELLPHFPWKASILVFAVIILTMSLAIIPSLISMRKQNIAEEMRSDI